MLMHRQTGFDLNRRVIDAVLFVQLIAHSREPRVSGVARWADNMCGKRDRFRRQRPDV